MVNTRRSFLRLFVAGATAIQMPALFAEPLTVMLDYGPWVEDRGDFYIVRVPERKVFAREEFLKPVIFILGSGSLVDCVSVKAYANVLFKTGAVVNDCQFDGSGMRTEEKRSVVLMAGSGGTFQNSHFIGSKDATILETSASLTLQSPVVRQTKQGNYYLHS